MAIGVVLLRVVAPLQVWAMRGTPEVPLAKAHVDAVNEATLHQALREPSFWLPDASFTFYSFAAAALWAPLMPAFAAKSRIEVQTLAVAGWFGPAKVLGRFLHLWLGHAVPPRTCALAVLGGLPVSLPMSLAIFALADHTAALLLFALRFGVAIGWVTIVRGSLVPNCFGRAHVSRISGAMAAISLMALAGRAAAPLATA